MPVEIDLDIAADSLLTLARAMSRARDVSLDRVSYLAHGDSPALGKLANGTGSITLRKWGSAMTWLSDRKNWPKGTKPPKVWRPPQLKGASNGKQAKIESRPAAR